MPERSLKTQARLVGARVSQVRRQHGLTLDRTAQLAAISRGALERLERGTEDIRVTVVLRVAWVLDVNPGALFDHMQYPSELEASVKRGLARQGWHSVRAGCLVSGEQLN